MEAIVIVLTRDVAGESVPPIRPPKACAVVGIERENLLWQGHIAKGLHGEIAVQHVPLLGRVFEEKAVPARLVADAIPDEQMVGAVDGDPAVVRIPDARAEHAAAAHRIAHEMEVNRILAQHALFAEMPELRITDASRRVAVIHRVTTRAGRFGGLDDDIAREVGDFTTHHAFAVVRLLQGTIQREHRAFDGGDHTLLRADGFLSATRLCLKRRPRLNGGCQARRDDDPVANVPVGHLFIHRHADITHLGRRGDLQPGALHRRAMHVPAPAAGDDGRQRFGIGAFELAQTDGRLYTRWYRQRQCADFENWLRSACLWRGSHIVAVKTIFCRGFAWLDLDESHI